MEFSGEFIVNQAVACSKHSCYGSDLDVISQDCILSAEDCGQYLPDRGPVSFLDGAQAPSLVPSSL